MTKKWVIWIFSEVNFAKFRKKTGIECKRASTQLLKRNWLRMVQDSRRPPSQTYQRQKCKLDRYKTCFTEFWRTHCRSSTGCHSRWREGVLRASLLPYPDLTQLTKIKRKRMELTPSTDHSEYYVILFPVGPFP